MEKVRQCSGTVNLITQSQYEQGRKEIAAIIKSFINIYILNTKIKDIVFKLCVLYWYLKIHNFNLISHYMYKDHYYYNYTVYNHYVNKVV